MKSMDYIFNTGGNQMDTRLLKRVRELYNVDYIPYWQNRENQRKWVKAVRLLGNKSLLAKQQEKLNVPK